MKPTVGIDIDGVLYQWEPTARKILSERVGEPVSVSQNWDSIKEQVSDTDWKWLWASRGARRRVFSEGPAHDGAVEGVKELENHFYVALVTSRPRDVADLTMQWLAEREIKPHLLVHVPSGMKKWEVAPRCAMYVEDNVDNCEGLTKNLGVTVWCPRRPWNKTYHLRTEGLVKPFSDWKEVTEWASQNLALS